MGSIMPPIEFNLFKFLIKFPIWFLLIIPIIFFTCVILPIFLNILFDWFAVATLPLLISPIMGFFSMWALISIAILPIMMPGILFTLFYFFIVNSIWAGLKIVITGYYSALSLIPLLGLITVPFMAVINFINDVIFAIVGSFSKLFFLLGFIFIWLAIGFFISLILNTVLYFLKLALLPVILISLKGILFFGGIFLTLGIGPILILFTGLTTVLSVDIESWLKDLWEDFKIPVIIMLVFIMTMVLILTIALLLLLAGPIFGKLKGKIEYEKLIKNAEKTTDITQQFEKNINVQQPNLILNSQKPNVPIQ
jgi:hypothetical protein